MSTRIDIAVDENTLKELVVEYLSTHMGTRLEPTDIKIEVKSKQNYKAEWESSEFRARVTKLIS